MLLLSSIPSACAMGKRPRTKDKTESEEFVSPEIEIITKSELNIKLLTNEQDNSESFLGVSPTEILPAVGEDSSITARRFRTQEIQTALTNSGFEPGVIDGKMGPKTKKAIREFQRANSLTADGTVGPKTWEKLKVYLYSTQTESQN